MGFTAPIPPRDARYHTRYCVLINVGDWDAAGYSLYSFVEGGERFGILSAGVDNLRGSFSYLEVENDGNF
jgi:hypothetical protein